MKFSPHTTAGVLCGLLLAFLSCSKTQGAEGGDPLAWPAINSQNQPWTRWWWLGSAVDEPNLTRLLQQYHDAGIGGVEICSIYGARGYENKFIDFLSPQWMQMLAHATQQAKRLGMGVDMTTGTGWPFGGPTVSAAEASAAASMKSAAVHGNASIDFVLPPGRVQCVEAISDAGRRVDLAAQAHDGKLSWTAPAGEWRIYAIAARGPVQQVKRAAPGGVGNVLDPFSPAKLDNYLSRFDDAFKTYTGLNPRSQFHDSYEYYNASWTDDLLDQFAKRRGYDLRTQLPAFFGEGPADLVARVKCDYRETIAELHLDYVNRWTQWAHARGNLTRNQAHGASANLIDAYAAADIPETEIYARYEERHMPMLKFSSSAAHLKGTALASSESFTWLGEHFNVPLSQVKRCADFLMLSGVNHIFFHGIPYSPADAPWPGWQFYAAVNFGPTGGLWHDLPAFNSYVAHCQAILQSGRPSNDVLLYVPFHDLWQTPQGLLTQFTTPGQWMFGQPFYQTAVTLWERGYGYDEISERFLADAKVKDGAVILNGNSYRTIVIPKTQCIGVATMKRLVELANDGAKIAVVESLPADVPGLADFEKRRLELKDIQAAIPFGPDVSGIRTAAVGKGRIALGSDIDALLRSLGTVREAMVDQGLRFVRRTHEHGYHYFIVNWSDHDVDAMIPLGTAARSAAILDPMLESRAGAATLKPAANGNSEVYLQLRAHESCILRTFTDSSPAANAYAYLAPAAQPVPVAGAWRVQFIDGGPELPQPYQSDVPSLWTTRDDPELKRFAGTARYQIEFDRPAGDAQDWLLDLGAVHESARVRINGREIATLILPPFQVSVGKFLHSGRNTLEVDVTNLAANRIADMDRRKVKWKYFYDANVSSLQQRNGLDASNWPLRDSGLAGPVTLQAMKSVLAPGTPAPLP